MKQLNAFKKALDLYYKGDWIKANDELNKIDLPLADVFKDRTKNKKSPANWDGIWTMTNK